MRRDLVIAALGLAGCGRDADPAPAQTRGSIVADSTIAARDYIGPAACGECHPDEHARWSKSLHAAMNRRAEGDAVIGNFATTVATRGGEARFAHVDGVYTMTFARRAQAGRDVDAANIAPVRYRVTRTIGVRGLQEYVGIEEGRTEEVRMPFGWWPRRGGWFAQPYYDPWLAEDGTDAHAPVREPWAERCPWCHSTYPFEQRIARTSGPRKIGHGLEQFYTPARPAAASPRLAVDQQVTVGISCESCHLGGRAHAAGAPIHFVPIGAVAGPDAPAATTFAAERADARIVNTVCEQYHSGPSPRYPDGGATRNSSEALDLAAAPCTNLRCTDCHDPHRADARADDARAIAACTRCHGKLADATAARAHAKHDGVSCLDCHMPRIVMGIDRHVRTHRIASPSDRAMLAAGAPNACNLCHLDRSIRWTVDELRARTGRRVDPSRWAYDDIDGNVGELWLASEEPAIRIVAAAAYGRSKLARFVWPALVRGLDDPLPYVRAWTLFAVEDALGHTVVFDPSAPPEQRRKQIATLRPPPPPPGR